MKFFKKCSALFVLLVVCLYVLSLNDAALAKKSDKDKKKKEGKKSAKVEGNAQGNAAGNASAVVPPIPKLPVSIPVGMRDAKMAKGPTEAMPVNLNNIATTQRDLELLATRYDDLRRTQEDQLLSLRALASQAKIHAQLLDGIKANMIAKPAQGLVGAGVLDASNLEKYRLIRERAVAQKSMINEIAQSQARVKNALATVSIPAPPPSIKPPAGATQKPSMEAVMKSREINSVQNAVADAKKQQEKLRAEKEKKAEQEKEEVKDEAIKKKTE